MKMSMEKYDADIFDIVYDDELPDSNAEGPGESGGCLSPKDAFILSLNQFGRVSLEYMSGACGRDKDSLIELLEGRLIWKDPRCYDPASPYDGWITREQYVRGNIYRLLDEAKKADQGTGLFAENIELLKSVLPDGPEQDDIMVTLGSTWVPAEYYLRFVCELLEMVDFPPELYLDSFFGKWVLRGGCTYNRARNERIYGTYRMHALRIIEHTMNASQIRVYDHYTDRITGKTVSVLNKADTMAAQEKQSAILREFQDWLQRNPEVRTQLQEIYTDRYGYQLIRYDGSFLELPGMNPQISLYAHQKSAIARIILSENNVLLSHDVGAGKTFAFAAGIHERLRMGLSRKALLVVPNAVFEATAEAVRQLYPDEAFVPISVKDFVPSKREAALRRIIDAEGGFFMLASSSFDMIGMSKQHYLAKKRAEIAECVREINASKDFGRTERLRTHHEKLLKEYRRISEAEERFLDCFDHMGIDMLIVDECHNYKNISLHSNMEPVAGLHSKGSKKADLMLEKCDLVRSGGGKLVFATGTPLTNSMADLFALQRYLQPEELEFLNISQFNEWVNTFCTKHTEFEIDATAASFRFVTRFDRFHNLPELMALFGNVCDLYTIVPEELNLPDFNGHINVLVPRSAAQAAYIQKIVARTEAIRKGKVDRKEDNSLKITTDGRKCALDIRLVAPEMISGNAPAVSKAASAASVICRIYREHPGMTQAVFCDISTPGKGFNLYEELRQLLTAAGIPEEEIAFIHDAATDSARQKLIRRFNAGEIRILLGSTQKLGLGVNIQERLIAVHHLDAPWKPSDMVQREGRAIRQGNLNSEVLIYRYVTASSFDAYTWQILENKQRFISSFLSGNLDRSHRSEQDIGDMILNYSEIKALAIGNPLIKERVELSNRLSRARARSRQRQEELHTYLKTLSELPAKCDVLRGQIEAVAGDIKIYGNHRKSMSRDARDRFGRELLLEIGRNRGAGEDKVLCWYRGFRIVIPSHQDPEHPYIMLRHGPEIAYRVDMKDARAGGCCTRIDNVLQALPERRKTLQNRLNGLLSACADAEEQVREGNPYAGKVETLCDELTLIDERLKEEMDK